MVRNPADQAEQVLPSFRLDGRVAVVTGSRRGLGQGIAVALAAAGADLALIDRREADVTASAVAATGRSVHQIRLDLAEATPGEIRRAVDECAESLGGLDILVNNAGIIRRAPAESHSSTDWDEVLTVNLDAAFHLSQAAGRQMLAAGWGRIVNVASMLSFQGGVLVPGYAAAKHGLVGLTKALANEWATRGVTVNAIAPGYMATDNTAPIRQDEAREAAIRERIPMGRWGSAADLAGAVVFLCSPAAEYITGAVLPVDGGWLAR